MNGVPEWLHETFGDSLDMIYKWVLGDQDPNSLQNGWDVTTDQVVNVLNPNTPDMPGVYYQSYAGKVKTAPPTILLAPTWAYAQMVAGDNDGLVSVESAKWGHFRGVESGSDCSPGVDHVNLIGHLFGATPDLTATSSTGPSCMV